MNWMRGGGGAGGGTLGLRLASPFEHLEWLESHKNARHNLGSSSVMTLSLEDVGPLDPSQPVGWGCPDGDPELVELISELYGVDRESVLVTNGAGEAYTHIIMVCVEKGCEVLCESPVYKPLETLPEFLGARVVRFSRAMESGFGVDVEKLKEMLSRKCRAVVLSNLHNPSCALLGEREMKAIAETARDAGAILISDEVYLDCLKRGPGPAASLADNAVSLNSLSKAYGAGGFRLGWMLGPPELVRAVKRLRDYTTIAPNRIGEEVAKNLLRRREEVLARTRRLTQTNIKLFSEWADRRKDVVWHRPPGGTTCFPRILKKTPTLELARRLYEEEGALVLPGEFFGAPGHFRIGLGQNPTATGPALDALGRFLDRSD